MQPSLHPSSRRPRGPRAPGVLALAALGLAALAPAARAQTLDLTEGSALIVHNTTQSGTFLNSTDYAFGGGAGPATYQYDQITNFNGYGINVNVTLAAGSSVNTATVFGVVNVNGGTVGSLTNDGFPNNAGSPPTNFTSVTAGSVTSLFNSNTVNVSGGTVGTITNMGGGNGAGNQTVDNISGGSVGDIIDPGGAAVTGGTITSLEQTEGSLSVSAGAIGTLTTSYHNNAAISGGTITTLNASAVFSAFTPNSGGLVLSGGTVGAFNNAGTSSVTGGTIGALNNTGSLTASGGTISALDNSSSAQLNAGASVTSGTNEAKGRETILGGSQGALTNYGTAILRNGGGSLGTLTNYGTFTSDDPNSPTGGAVTNLIERGGVASLYAGQFSFLDNFTGGTLDVFANNLVLANGFLTGTFGDGERLNAAYKNDGGTLNLFPAPAVPEASTVVSLGLLLALGMGGIVVAAKKRKITP